MTGIYIHKDYIADAADKMMRELWADEEDSERPTREEVIAALSSWLGESIMDILLDVAYWTYDRSRLGDFSKHLREVQERSRARKAVAG